jgi:hypothetical protein
MIVFIDWILQEQFDSAVEKAVRKLGPAPETLRLLNLNEGKSVQTLYVGDRAGMDTVRQRLYNEYLPQNHLQPSGFYHEIYLNDPVRTAPEKRKIVIRQPVL